MKILELLAVFAFGCLVGFLVTHTFAPATIVVEEKEPAVVWGEKEPESWKRRPADLDHQGVEIPQQHVKFQKRLKHLKMGQSAWSYVHNITLDNSHRAWLSRNTDLRDETKGMMKVTRTRKGIICDLSNSDYVFSVGQKSHFPDYDYAENTNYIPIYKIIGNEKLKNEDNKEEVGPAPGSPPLPR
tara:strand:+ start:2899 stop:3453 length:555 start_codon:yes stop_codon:yes gene_type:complete